MSGKAVVAVNSISVNHGGGYPRVGIEAVILQGDISKLTASRVELALAASMNLQPDKPAELQHPEYVDSGIYKGCEWCISKCHDHLCAYICVEGLGLHYESIEDCKLDMHGGCSWVGGIDHVPGMRSNGRQWVGWDYNHFGDKPDDFDAKRVKDEVYGVIDEAIMRSGK